MRRVISVLVGSVVIGGLTASASAAPAHPVPVVVSSESTRYASMDGGWVAWTTFPRGVTFVRNAAYRRWRVTPQKGSNVGSIKLDPPFAGSVWYVRHLYGRANIAWYDLQTHRSHRAPANVNSRNYAEIDVSASGDYLAFTRDTTGGFSGKIVLYRFSTKKKRVVAEDGKETSVRLGQLNGDYIAFARCARLCAIYRYRISTDSTRRMTNRVGSRALTDPAVLPDGTVYFIRGGTSAAEV